MSMRLPEAPYFSAFSTRFSNTRISSSRSARTSSVSGGMSILTSTPRSRASVCSASATWRTIGARSTWVSGCTCALSSMRDSDRRSSISRAMRVACAFMMSRKRSRACASLRAEPCSVSMKPDSEASGVRSSWLALATKSARISSTRLSGVRSCRVTNTSSRRPAIASARATGTMNASDQRSDGTFSKNSTRWVSPVSTALRTASMMSGMRSAIDSGVPRVSAGATTRAAAFEATTKPRRSSAMTASGSPETTASTSQSAASGLPSCEGAGTATGGSEVVKSMSEAAATIRNATEACSVDRTPATSSATNTSAAAASTRRARLSRPSQDPGPSCVRRWSSSVMIRKVIANLTQAGVLPLALRGDPVFAPRTPEFAAAEERQCDRERRDVVEQAKEQQPGEQVLLVVLPQGHQHRGIEYPEPAGRVAGEAQQGGGDKDHRQRDEADIGLVRQQHVHGGRAAGEVDDADADLQQGERAVRQRDFPVLPADHAQRAPHPGHVAAQHEQHRIGDGPVEPWRQLVDRRGGTGHKRDPEAEHRRIAEPEGQPGDEADLGDLDRRQALRRVDAVAHRAAGEHACPDIVSDGVAGEGRERRGRVGHLLAADRAQ